MKNLSWPGECADLFLSRQHGKKCVRTSLPLFRRWLKIPRLTFSQRWVNERGAELRGRLGEKTMFCFPYSGAQEHSLMLAAH